MNKWLIGLALLLVTTAAGMAGVRWLEAANRRGTCSDLAQLGQALLMYQSHPQTATQPSNDPIVDSEWVMTPAVAGDRGGIFTVTTQPTTQPTTGPARSAMIRGCSNNHDTDGQDVLFADESFASAPLTSNPADNIFTAKPLLWPELRGGGMYILLRHAKTDGSGVDPANFNLADRSTQRNLSDDGVAQARRIGQVIKQKDIPVAKVVSSQYYRCRNTAKHAFGKFETDPVLNSLEDEKQLAKLKQLLGTKTGGGNVILVTHQVNLKAATGIVPTMGDAVVVYPNPDGTFAVLGELKIEP